MSRFFREAAPAPADPEAAHLAEIAARHVQAVAYIERTLRANRGNRAMADVLLDLRNLLRPPTPAA